MGIIKKGWGEEQIIVSNEKYCGKFLKFNQGGRFSMHFHAEKEETWYVMSGAFELTRINTDDASEKKSFLKTGDTWTNYQLEPHQLYCLEEGVILEISTEDCILDNYRVRPGDSQK